jgi:PAS fold
MMGADMALDGAEIGPGVLIRSLNGRIAFWSPEMEQRYGFPADEAQGSLSHELLRLTSWQSRDEIETTLRQQRTWTGGLILHRADGRPVVAANHWHLFDEPSGAVPFITELHSDIVPTGAAEEIGLADVMATVTQELSQPMAALSAYLNGIQKILRRPERNGAHLQSATEVALKEIQRGSDVLKRIRAIGETLRTPRLRDLHARLTATAEQTTGLREAAQLARERALTLRYMMLLQRLLRQDWIAGAGGRIEAALRQLLSEQERRLAAVDKSEATPR